jgi:hypothetical protein
MEYMKLISGIILLLIFTVILIRNFKRKGLIHLLFRIDTVIGMLAGAYLVITSLH